MAINKNHEFEELNGIKCAIVEKNASKERVEFLKKLLEFNNFTVVIAASPPPKVAAPAAPPPPPPPVISVEGDSVQPPPPPPPPAPETFTIGVTDVSFNPTNALYGRLLHTPDGHVVTVAYWQQKETISDDEVPYYERG